MVCALSIGKAQQQHYRQVAITQCAQVIASRCYGVVPVVEGANSARARVRTQVAIISSSPSSTVLDDAVLCAGLYDMGNLAAVCRSADGEKHDACCPAAHLCLWQQQW